MKEPSIKPYELKVKLSKGTSIITHKNKATTVGQSSKQLVQFNHSFLSFLLRKTGKKLEGKKDTKASFE